jgi:hypothetical protein
VNLKALPGNWSELPTRFLGSGIEGPNGLGLWSVSFAEVVFLGGGRHSWFYGWRWPHTCLGLSGLGISFCRTKTIAALSPALRFRPILDQSKSGHSFQLHARDMGKAYREP